MPFFVMVSQRSTPGHIDHDKTDTRPMELNIVSNYYIERTKLLDRGDAWSGRREDADSHRRH